jgi:hypothetical protein
MVAQRKRNRRKPMRIIEQLEAPTVAQLANDDFDRDFITHAETNTKAMAYRRRDSCIVEKWCKQGGIGFDHGAQRIIANCQLFWMRLGEPRLIANYGERLAPSTSGDGWTRQEALDELHRYKKMVPEVYWAVFENVARYNEPAGVAGSSFATNDAQRIQSAKVITGFVASFIAGQLGY